MDLGIRVADHERERPGPQPELLSRHISDSEHLLKGKPSVIKEYCEKIIRKNGDYLHLWVCIKRRRQTIGCPVQFQEDLPLGIPELRKYCGWFKRYFSLYSATAVKERQVSRPLPQHIIWLIELRASFPGSRQLRENNGRRTAY